MCRTTCTHQVGALDNRENQSLAIESEMPRGAFNSGNTQLVLLILPSIARATTIYLQFVAKIGIPFLSLFQGQWPTLSRGAEFGV